MQSVHNGGSSLSARFIRTKSDTFHACVVKMVFFAFKKPIPSAHQRTFQFYKTQLTMKFLQSRKFFVTP